jgi:hypothetical protein
VVDLALLHFVVRNLTYTLTPTGYLITCYTNYPCHLYLRWTNVVPQKHINPIIRRGAQVGTYIDQCFVVFTDLEQTDPGDTYTHTFLVEPWPHCETRWFYFWGTVAGQLSPSASCIFSKHRYAPTLPITVKIYSAPGHHYGTTDGSAYRTPAPEPWQPIHDGPGNYAEPLTYASWIFINPNPTPNLYTQIARWKATFDLSPIPLGAIILSAQYKLFLWTTGDWLYINPTFALFTAPAPPFDDVIPSDYQSFGTTPISDIIPQSATHPQDWVIFTITPANLYRLVPGQKLAIGIREASYDAPNIMPTWRLGNWSGIYPYTVDEPQPQRHPYLEVTYQP